MKILFREIVAAVHHHDWCYADDGFGNLLSLPAAQWRRQFYFHIGYMP